MSCSTRSKEIHSAVFSGDVPKMKQILAQGCSVDVLDANGNTPLIMALLAPLKKKKKGELIELLLSCGSDVNIVNNDGDTCLHLAVKASMRQKVPKKFILRLLDHGADPSVLNFRGLTASKLAYQIGNVALGDTLLLYDGTRRSRNDSGCENNGELSQSGIQYNDNSGNEQINSDQKDDPKSEDKNAVNHEKVSLLTKELSLRNEDAEFARKGARRNEDQIDAKLQRKTQPDTDSMSYKARGTRSRGKQLMMDIFRWVFPTTALATQLGDDLTYLRTERRLKEAECNSEEIKEPISKCEEDVARIGKNNLQQGSFKNVPPILPIVAKGNEYMTLKSLSIHKEMIPQLQQRLESPKSVDDNFHTFSGEINGEVYAVR